MLWHSDTLCVALPGVLFSIASHSYTNWLLSTDSVTVQRPDPLHPLCTLADWASLTVTFAAHQTWRYILIAHLTQPCETPAFLLYYHSFFFLIILTSWCTCKPLFRASTLKLMTVDWLDLTWLDLCCIVLQNPFQQPPRVVEIVSKRITFPLQVRQSVNPHMSVLQLSLLTLGSLIFPFYHLFR